MESQALWLLQHLLLALGVNGLLTIGLAGAQQGIICNESLMLQNLPLCGKSFQEMMHKVDSAKWCNLTEFIFCNCITEEGLHLRCEGVNPFQIVAPAEQLLCTIWYYNNFTLCTEHKAAAAKCFWPNPIAEGFITGIHKQFFSNCTSRKVHWEDPPVKILITLIFIPVLLTIAMIGLVVWCSKRNDILV